LFEPSVVDGAFPTAISWRSVGAIPRAPAARPSVFFVFAVPAANPVSSTIVFVL